jgi:hypothetical protein
MARTTARTLPRSARRLAVSGLLALAVTTAATATSTGGRFFHLVAEDLESDGDRVSINVPFSIVEKTLALLPYDDARDHGRLRVNGRTLRREDLREFWGAVKSARDGEPVEIVLEEGRRSWRDDRAGRHIVRLRRVGGALSISSRDEDGGRVEMLLPGQFVDALLEGGDESFTLDSVVRAFGTLEAGGPGDATAIRIDSEDARVRIWVDGSIESTWSEAAR